MREARIRRRPSKSPPPPRHHTQTPSTGNYLGAKFYIELHLTRVGYVSCWAILLGYSKPRCWVKVETRRHIYKLLGPF